MGAPCHRAVELQLKLQLSHVHGMHSHGQAQPCTNPVSSFQQGNDANTSAAEAVKVGMTHLSKVLMAQLWDSRCVSSTKWGCAAWQR